jgi:hypothetical protein
MMSSYDLKPAEQNSGDKGSTPEKRLFRKLKSKEYVNNFLRIRYKTLRSVENSQTKIG